MEFYDEAEAAAIRDASASFSKIPEARDLRKSKREWVYFIQARHSPELIKIGRAYRIGRRLRSLQFMSPVPLKLIGLIEAPRGTEALLLHAWREYRVYGEWFVPAQPLVDFISNLPKPARLELQEIPGFAKVLGVAAQRAKGCMLSGLRRRNRRKM
jgi:hypothetical protein